MLIEINFENQKPNCNYYSSFENETLQRLPPPPPGSLFNRAAAYATFAVAQAALSTPPPATAGANLLQLKLVSLCHP